MTEAIARRWRAARPTFEETSRVILSPSAARARAQSMTSRGDVTATLRATYAAHLHLHLHYYHYRSGLIKRYGTTVASPFQAQLSATLLFSFAIAPVVRGSIKLSLSLLLRLCERRYCRRLTFRGAEVRL